MSDPLDPKRMTVSVELGLTIPWGEMGFVKPRLGINDIDPASDIEKQIKQGLEIGVIAFAAIDGQLERVISDVIAPMSNQPGFTERVSKLEKGMMLTRKNLKIVADRLRQLDPKLFTEVIVGVEANGAVVTASSVNEATD